MKMKFQIVVLGSGPAGYSAAFRCADLGMNVALIEKYKDIGGVCLNVGCIPSKSLLYLSKNINDSKYFFKKGILNYHNYSLNIKNIVSWKNKIIKKMSKGLKYLSKKRNIKILRGNATFLDKNNLIVLNEKGEIKVNFQNAIIATGSKPMMIENVNKSDRIWDSTKALSLPFIPKKLLIIGGGIIGLEIATIYTAIGSYVEIVEKSDSILQNLDEDILESYKNYITPLFKIKTKIKILEVIEFSDYVYVTFINEKKIKIKNKYDAVLVSIGRKPNIDCIGKLKIKLGKLNNIIVNNRMKTNIRNIYAIGDVIGEPMLAHKGMYEGKLVAEIISGKNYEFDASIMPCVAYTNPEISWIGITEKIAIKNNIDIKVSVLPWIVSGKAVAINSHKGIIKLIFDKKYNRIIGGSAVGSNAGDLLCEIGLAIEMGCTSKDIALTIHPHPTIGELVKLAAENVEGTITDF